MPSHAMAWKANKIKQSGARNTKPWKTESGEKSKPRGPSLAQAYATGNFSDKRFPDFMKEGLTYTYSKFSKKGRKSLMEAWKEDIPDKDRDVIESHFRAELVRTFLGNILEDVVPGRVENLRSEAVELAFMSVFCCVRGGHLEDLFTEELMGAALPPQKLDFHKYLNFVQISAWVIGQTKRLRESELLVLTFLVVQIVLKSYNQVVSRASESTGA